MLKFIGNGSAFNTSRGNTSAYMTMGSELIIIDCGEDVFSRLRRLDVLEKASRVHVFITHLHSDHVGSLSSLIYYLYYKVYGMDRSRICVYYPDSKIVDFLNLLGTNENFYTHYINKWDELYIEGKEMLTEYMFYETPHDTNLAASYYITFDIKKTGSFLYSGDTAQCLVDSDSIQRYDRIYQEVTFNPHVPVHTQYSQLLENTRDFTESQKKKIYLMHLEEEADESRIIADGFNIAN